MTSKEERLNRALGLAEYNLTQAFDIRLILNQQRALKTILSTMFAKPAQKMTYLQRKQCVIEATSAPKDIDQSDGGQDSNYEFDSDGQMVTQLIELSKGSQSFAPQTRRLWQGVFNMKVAKGKKAVTKSKSPAPKIELSINTGS